MGSAVATTTAWSAGAGRPGLLEPMGVTATIAVTATATATADSFAQRVGNAARSQRFRWPNSSALPPKPVDLSGLSCRCCDDELPGVGKGRDGIAGRAGRPHPG
jgi:hypothetical protein